MHGVSELVAIIQMSQLRRERIAERMKSLQELVPNANKVRRQSLIYLSLLYPLSPLSINRVFNFAVVSALFAAFAPGLDPVVSLSGEKAGIFPDPRACASVRRECLPVYASGSDRLAVDRNGAGRLVRVARWRAAPCHVELMLISSCDVMCWIFRTASYRVVCNA